MERLPAYIILCLVIFIICPRRGSTSGNETKPTNRSKKKFDYEKLRLDLTEPGFDFTEEEAIKFKIWTKGVIPYYVDDLSFDKIFRDKLRSLLGSFNSVTGLRFIELQAPPLESNERYVMFINRRSQLNCEDYTTSSFTNTGVQKVVLGYDCLGAGGGALAATVLALAGVPPQHNAPDRDKYVDVVMDNIIPEKRSLFQKLKNDEWLFHQVPYDFVSAGHYNFHKYSINGSSTITPKRDEFIHIPIGEGDGISPKDIWKIRMLYNFISLKRKKTKASDCSQIFKPGLKFSDFEPPNEDIILPRQKPSKYLGLSEDELEENNNANRSPHDGKKRHDSRNKLKAKLLKNKGKNRHGFGKDKLGDLPDYDTDADSNKHKRLKLSGKFKNSRAKKYGMGKDQNMKKRNALNRGKVQLSKMYVMSDIDTDRGK